MDEGDPEMEGLIQRAIDEETKGHGLTYHQLRYRISGASVWAEMHLLFPRNTPLEEAHKQASEVEAALSRRLPGSFQIVTHLEPLDEHDMTHRKIESSHR